MTTDYLKIAKDAYSNSTTWFDSNYRNRIEDNIRMFHSRHPRNSKYNSEAYKYRSRLFVPKTRSFLRKNEAALSAAYFSNVEVADVKPMRESDQMQRASAAINKELLQYRLTKTIPWFKILNGAFQEAQSVGVVVSRQHWEYKERMNKISIQTLNEFGEDTFEEVEEIEVISDKPCISIVPIENFRFAPSADWTDPINTSPYLIEQIPMYLADLKGMMEEADPKTGVPKFKKMPDDKIKLAMSENSTAGESIRIDRENQQEDPKGNDSPVSEFDIIWVHRNIVRIDGRDMIYYTLGVHELLTDPEPLKNQVFHGERDYIMGISVIETHRAFPNSLVGIGSELQKMSNELANSRMDNVRLVINKRYKVKRGTNVDIASLHRNVAGGVTMCDNLTDIESEDFTDVTQSSYIEQDRVNSSYDELVGNFSAGSAQQSQVNNAANETLGGLGIVSANASLLTDYLIRTFNETWVEPVLRQLVKLEQKYETDMTVLSIAAEKAELYQRYGVDQITDDLLNQELTLNVNVGIGATDPGTRLQKFIFAVDASTRIAAMPPPNADIQAIIKEIFSNVGYKDGSQFFMDEDNEQNAVIQQLQQQIQQLTQIIQQKQIESDAKLKSEQLKAVTSIEKQRMADEADLLQQEKDLRFRREELISDKFVELEKIDAKSA